MLSLNDLHFDDVMVARVKRELRRLEAEDEEDLSDNDAPAGTQQNHPLDVQEDDGMDIDAETPRQQVSRVKKEKSERSRGISKAPARARSESSDPGSDEMQDLTQY